MLMDDKSNNLKAWLFALGVHLFAVLPLFWLEHSKPIFEPPKPKPIINASIIGPLPKPPKPTPEIKQPKTVKKPEAKSKPKPKMDNAKKLAEQKAAQEKAIALKQAEEKKRQEAERKKAEEEKKIAEQKHIEEQKRAEEEKRAKELAEKKAEIRRKLQKAAKDMAAKDAATARETDRLKAEMVELISEQWNRPMGMEKKLSVVIQLVLLPSGELSGLKILESSGNEAFDRSAVQAAKLASPFSMFLKYSPEVRNASRITVIKFTPEDLFN